MNTFRIIVKLFILLVFLTLNTFFAFSQISPKIILHHEDVDGFVKGMSFSHDNLKLLTTGGRYAMMWNVENGEKISTFPENSGFGSIDFSIDDKRIVTTHVAHGRIAIWDVDTGKEITMIQGEIDLPPPQSYTAVTFSPDGKKVLGGDVTGNLYIIDIEQKKVVKKIYALGGFLKNIQFLPDASRVIASSSILFFDSGDIIKKFDSPVYLSVDGKYLFSFIAKELVLDGNAYKHSYNALRWNSDTLEILDEKQPFTANGEFLISPNGKLIAVLGREKNSPYSVDYAHIVDVETGERISSLNVDGKTVIFDQVKFSRDGNIIACVKKDFVYLYDISDLYSNVTDSENLKK